MPRQTLRAPNGGAEITVDAVDAGALLAQGWLAVPTRVAPAPRPALISPEPESEEEPST